jgi:hypothetical protein
MAQGTCSQVNSERIDNLYFDSKNGKTLEYFSDTCKKNPIYCGKFGCLCINSLHSYETNSSTPQDHGINMLGIPDEIEISTSNQGERNIYQSGLHKFRVAENRFMEEPATIQIEPKVWFKEIEHLDHQSERFIYCAEICKKNVIGDRSIVKVLDQSPLNARTAHSNDFANSNFPIVAFSSVGDIFVAFARMKVPGLKDTYCCSQGKYSYKEKCIRSPLHSFCYPLPSFKFPGPALFSGVRSQEVAEIILNFLSVGTYHERRNENDTELLELEKDQKILVNLLQTLLKRISTGQEITPSQDDNLIRDLLLSVFKQVEYRFEAHSVFTSTEKFIGALVNCGALYLLKLCLQKKGWSLALALILLLTRQEQLNFWMDYLTSGKLLALAQDSRNENDVLCAFHPHIMNALNICMYLSMGNVEAAVAQVARKTADALCPPVSSELSLWRFCAWAAWNNYSHLSKSTLELLAETLSSYGRAHAAAFCMITSAPKFELNPNHFKIPLLGKPFGRQHSPLFLFLPSIMLTEIYEFILFSSASSPLKAELSDNTSVGKECTTLLPYFQGYKLILAKILLSYGFKVRSSAYLTSIKKCYEEIIKENGCSAYFHRIYFKEIDFIQKCLQGSLISEDVKNLMTPRNITALGLHEKCATNEPCEINFKSFPPAFAMHRKRIAHKRYNGVQDSKNYEMHIKPFETPICFPRNSFVPSDCISEIPRIDDLSFNIMERSRDLHSESGGFLHLNKEEAIDNDDLEDLGFGNGSLKNSKESYENEMKQEDSNSCDAISTARSFGLDTVINSFNNFPFWKGRSGKSSNSSSKLQANLGLENSFHFDTSVNRWVNKQPEIH